MIVNQMISRGIKLHQLLLIQPPTKTTYFSGDVFDTSGMVIQSIYTNDAHKEIIDYQITPSIIEETTVEMLVQYSETGRTRSLIIPITVLKVVDAPTQNGICEYTGSTLTPTWDNYDSSKLEMGGTTSAIEVGTYVATFTPKDGYVWKDGSGSEVKEVEWRIVASLADTLVDFEYTDNGDGTATITAWKHTLNGEDSTIMRVPDDSRIIL